ncbi:hypothetical protein LCGC14_3114000 [marine sediment metagenome]|uniref:Uncharacterized protein n=1 Tax=marine sediment metagenome TaxID=412755 RepID=A0A0F8WT84_9ZZZZ
MEKDKSWKKADYPNRIPEFHKRAQRYKETSEERANRVIKTLDWDKLSKMGKSENCNLKEWC